MKHAARRLSALYERESDSLWLYARSILRCDALAWDCLHAALTTLLDRSALPADEAALRGYLYRSVRNQALNLLRGRRREAARIETLRARAPLFANRTGVEPDDAARLDAALDELPPEQREVVVLKIWSSMSFQEIGAATDASPNTAASRYRYGIARLRARLEGPDA